jgi:hypothetical protein
VPFDGEKAKRRRWFDVPIACAGALLITSLLFFSLSMFDHRQPHSVPLSFLAGENRGP